MSAKSLFLKCNCGRKHEYQDAKYGTGIRSATPVNKLAKNGKLEAIRCTVCSREVAYHDRKEGTKP